MSKKRSPLPEIEIEQLKMKARFLDAFMRRGGLNSEQAKEFNEILGILREFGVKPWEM